MIALWRSTYKSSCVSFVSPSIVDTGLGFVMALMLEYFLDCNVFWLRALRMSGPSESLSRGPWEKYHDLFASRVTCTCVSRCTRISDGLVEIIPYPYLFLALYMYSWRLSWNYYCRRQWRINGGLTAKVFRDYVFLRLPMCAHFYASR